MLCCPPPLLAAALRAPLVVAGSWLPPSRPPGRGHRSAPARALLILSRAADRRCSGRAWRHQAARARWIHPATCSCAGAPRRHLIAWLRLLSIDLQLDGAMSSPGPAAKLALKRQTGLMGGDMGLAATTAAAQAQRSASAAQPAAVVTAAAAVATGAVSGAYDLQAMARASQSLPVVPARSSRPGGQLRLTHSSWLAVIVGVVVGVARRSSGAASSDGDGDDDSDSDGGGRSSRSDNRRVGCGAASAMSSTGPATKLALNARGWVWAWCGCFSVDCCLPPPVQQLDVFLCR